MNPSELSGDEIARHLLSGLLNGAFQGCLLTALVAGAVTLVPRLNAATRHAVYFVTLLLMRARGELLRRAALSLLVLVPS